MDIKSAAPNRSVKMDGKVTAYLPPTNNTTDMLHDKENMLHAVTYGV
jgi:hypothetical protein